MSPVDPVLGQPAGCNRESERIPTVMSGPPPGGHDLGTFQLAERAVSEPARIQKLLTAEPDRLLRCCDRRVRALPDGPTNYRPTGWGHTACRATTDGHSMIQTERSLASINLIEVVADHLQ